MQYNTLVLQRETVAEAKNNALLIVQKDNKKGAACAISLTEGA